jgi:hypothetical protein
VETIAENAINDAAANPKIQKDGRIDLSIRFAMLGKIIIAHDHRCQCIVRD